MMWNRKSLDTEDQSVEPHQRLRALIDERWKGRSRGTDEDFAKAVPISPGQLSKLVNGHVDLWSSRKLERIAELLDTTREWILAGDGTSGGPPAVREEEGGYEARAVASVDLDGNPLQSDVEIILSWLPEDMSARWAGEVTTDVRLAQVYAYGAEQDWSQARLAYIHRIREELRGVQ